MKERVIEDELGHGMIELTFKKDVTNLDVVESIHHHTFRCFKAEKIIAVAVKICPNEHQILIKPYYKLGDKIKDRMLSRVTGTMLNEYRENWSMVVSEGGSEMVVDIWNKFMGTEFIIEYDKKTAKQSLSMNIEMDDKQRDAYWMQSTTDGYNLYASFWRREWLKEKHKRQKKGGGKL